MNNSNKKKDTKNASLGELGQNVRIQMLHNLDGRDSIKSLNPDTCQITLLIHCFAWNRI